MILIAGTMNVDPAKVDDFMTEACELMRATHQEPGNLAYSFSRDPLEDGLIHIFEKWESEEALTEHMGLPHFTGFGAKIGDLGVTGASVKKYTGATEGDLF